MTAFKRFLILILCLSLLSGLSACTNNRPPDAKSLSIGLFTAEISGKMGKLDFSAVLSVEKDAAGEKQFRISYLSPSSLADVTAERSAKGISVSHNGIMFCPSEGTMDGLFLPLELLLTEEVASTVQKKEGCYALTFGGDRCITLSTDGIPQTVSAPDLYYRIVWWEKLQ